MSTLVADLTTTELEKIIENVLERKIIELFGNDSEFDLKESVQERLLAQQAEVLNGDKGISFDELVEDLGLANV